MVISVHNYLYTQKDIYIYIHMNSFLNPPDIAESEYGLNHG
jgi:hypothetical protein